LGILSPSAMRTSRAHRFCGNAPVFPGDLLRDLPADFQPDSSLVLQAYSKMLYDCPCT